MASRALARVGTAAATLAVGTWLLFDPSLPSFCLFQSITQTPCPACGLVRAFRLAGHGHWLDATKMHPLWGWFALWVIAWVFWEATTYRCTHRASASSAHRWLVALSLVTLILLTTTWAARLAGVLDSPPAIS